MTEKHTSFPGRVAVCSWSLQPADAGELLEKLALTGIRDVQLEIDPLLGNPPAWAGLEKHFAENNINIISGMMRCAGEDYTTLESIKETGGIAPDGTWEENLKNFREGAEIAARLGMKLVTLHAGFLPHETDAGFPKLKQRLETVAALFAEKGIKLGLETGQETAADLAHLLRVLGNPGIVVNFDPANMILYGKGDPAGALRALAPWLGQIHIKDATHAATPGAWGDEVPVGTGHVDWRRFFETLRELNYAGDFAIEREAGSQRVADICTARDFLKNYI